MVSDTIISDIEYGYQMDALHNMASFFFQELIKHYNFIMLAERHLDSRQDDFENEELDGSNDSDLANLLRKTIKVIEKTRIKEISLIKGLFVGFKEFCFAIDYDWEKVLKQVPIAECCHYLDYILSSEIEMNSEYAEKTKKFFLEHWHF